MLFFPLYVWCSFSFLAHIHTHAYNLFHVNPLIDGTDWVDMLYCTEGQGKEIYVHSFIQLTEVMITLTSLTVIIVSLKIQK